ncbi:LUD domain-containing protein [Lutimonas sp.]|uniref:LUD domain-containing protein n=1 Tax=Lutimonas sp. TaxID=1872403 RepID=UPI003D9AF75D
MSFFNKFFKNLVKTSQKEEDQGSIDQTGDLSIDELFVKKFIHKGGKFLYCTDAEEVQKNLVQVLQENQWNNVVTFDKEINDLLTEIKSAKTSKIIPSLPFMTQCECLIANDGSLMFSSKQLKDKKLKDLPSNFIVYAKTSQIVKDSRDGISGIRNRSEKNSPTIISSIKDFIINKTETDFMSYGNTNSKTLYLLLLEDL